MILATHAAFRLPMRIFLRLLAMFAVLVAAVLVLQQVASESGEVAVLTTVDANGDAQTTRLWIVDLEGRQYLRAGVPQAGWYQRMLADPSVEVRRGEVNRAYRAVPDLARVTDVNGLMEAKYGWADAYIGFLFGRDESVPVRLEPAP